MKVIESYGEDAVAGCRDTKTGLSGLLISDFPSGKYAQFYLAKRKSAKNASDSSLKLMSYASADLDGELLDLRHTWRY